MATITHIPKGSCIQVIRLRQAINNTDASAVIEEFVLKLETFLGAQRTHVDINAAWNSTRPSDAPDTTLQDMLHYVGDPTPPP